MENDNRISNMDSLRQKRKALKSSLTRLKTAIDAYSDDVDAGLVESHSLRLNEIWNDLNINHFAILDLCKTQSEFDAQQGDFDISESRVIEMRAKLFSVSRYQPTSHPMQNSSASFHAEPKVQDVRLPKLDLPTFSGSIQDWMSFHDLFSATIHNNHSLMPAQKLQYLKLSLRGDAARILQSMKVTDGNYAIAWELLTNRYENRRELVFAHIKRLTMQSSLQAESASGLRELVDTTNECMRTLEILDQPTQSWDSIVTFLILQKLDPETRRLWELSLPNNEVPSFKSLIEWLEQHAQALNSIAHTKTKVQSKPSIKPETKLHAKSHHTINETKTNNKCSICDGNHPYFKCSNFLAKSAVERMKSVKERKLCLNCLRPNHFASQCPSENTCKQCGEKHHSFLHFERTVIKTAEPQPTSVSTHVANSKHSQVLLATAMVLVKDISGKLQPCRAFIDSGSQANFVTNICVQRLRLQRYPINVDISGLAATEITNARHYSILNVVSNVNKQYKLTVEAFNISRVTGLLPNLPCDSAQWDHVSTLKLADPNFNKPGSIDILLGADAYAEIMLGEIRRGPADTPIAQETKLGWIVYGRAPPSTVSGKPIPHIVSCSTHLNLDKSLQRFWQLEDLPMKRILTAEEKCCEEKFRLTHRRDEKGRFIVRLPFKPDKILGNSYNMALRRFRSVENKLETNPEIKSQYHKFMQDYLNLGHMQRVPTSYSQKRDCEKFYLPHHCVFKASSTTTKLRVVFDGSAKSTSGNSLNDMLMVGPVVQDDLISLLLRFRLHNVALIADVVKMYRQVLVNIKDVDYQRILWRFSAEQPIEEYQLLTVTYGTASAPYLATMALKQLADDESGTYPLAAEITRRDFYVDDLMSGAESVELALQLQRELIQLTQAGGFQLQKWASNSAEVLQAVPSELRGADSPLTIDMDESIKTLGLLWNPSTDIFHFSVETFDFGKLTKRIILSDIARIFDPLGWLCCVTIVPKILMQRLWQENASWDDEIPHQFVGEFVIYRKALQELQQVTIPRRVIVPHVERKELHGFSDASERAFAALVYLRTMDNSGTVQMHLLAAKTKVAPLKQVTLPRLELCGAVLLSRLLTSIAASLHMQFDGVFAWSDSKTALAWIASPPQRWKTFIANRVAEIQDCQPKPLWSHIAGKENPADLATRGIYPSELWRNTLWWNGPIAFQLNNWKPPTKCNSKDITTETLFEERKLITVNIATIDLSILTRYSTLSMLKRITALCLRFATNSRSNSSLKFTGVLSVDELQCSLFSLIKQVQRFHFAEEIKCLLAKDEIPYKSRLKSLCPFLADNGLLRVGGRLQNATLTYNQKHPIILPTHSPLTTLIVRHVHLSHLHAGPALMLQVLRETYWILNAKNAVKLFYKRCVTCYRQVATSSTQLMASLPSTRVNPAPAFFNCGVDFAGPFLLKAIKGRGIQRYKAYVSLFICFCTRAIHLELVSDLSTQAFIAALKRFISRRGMPSTIHSDCGTNFIGANKELRHLRQLCHSPEHNQIVSKHLADTGIKWQFNPPAAPHFGGLWEAGVKSTKYHLRRIVGNEVLNFEEMVTILCQVEAVLNSRPLCPISCDPNDLTALTPGHFLVGSALTTIQEPNYTDIRENRLSRWQLMQKVVQHFWSRWSSEYLSRLQQRPKWLKHQPNIEKDALVLLKDERLPPLQWKLGRVIQTYPGTDGKTRVVSLKTADGEFKRPITKICLLPIETSQSSSDLL